MTKAKLNNNEQLREIYDGTGLSIVDFAALLKLSQHTVTNWLRPETNNAYRKCPSIVLAHVKMLQESGSLPSSDK